MLSSLLKERFLFVGLAAAILAYASEHSLLEMGRLPVLAAAFALVVAIVLVSTRIAHHAEILASKVRDPYGTMILTLSAVLVEVAFISNSDEEKLLASEAYQSKIVSALVGGVGRYQQQRAGRAGAASSGTVSSPGRN